MRTSRTFSLPSHEREGNTCAIPHVGFSGGVVRLSPHPATCRGPREDLSDFAPGSVAGPRVAQTVVVQLPCGAVSSTCSTSPARTIPPPAGEFHLPVVQNIQATCLDVVRDRFRGQGFSARTAGFLVQSLRPSTSLVYDRKWDIFCTWCTETQRDKLTLSLSL